MRIEATGEADQATTLAGAGNQHIRWTDTMDESLVMTVIGDDRPGLVETLARCVSAHGGSWLESRMARLGGKFAGILRVSVPQERAAGLLEAVGGLGAAGLTVVSEQSGAAVHSLQPVRLELTGSDHIGIVRDIAALLTARNINVEELETDRVTAPMSGEMLFKARALLHLPAGMSEDDLRVELEDLANDMMVDISLSEAGLD
jgi:glycine cleavage system regulatory protein